MLENCFTMDPLLVFLCVVLLISLPILKAKNKKTTKVKLPPSPPKLPIIGNLHQLGKLPHQNLHQLSQKYGPIMLLQLGNIPTLVISSAEMAKEVLQTHDIDFCSRPSSPGVKKLAYNFCDIAFSPYDDQWRRRRKIFVSHFSNSKSRQSLWEAREIEINHLMDSISLASGKAVNLDEKIYDLADGVITAVAFGKSHRGKQFEGQMLKDVINEIADAISCFSAEDFFPLIGKIIDRFTGQRQKLDDCFSKLDGYLQKVVNEHLERQNKPKDGHEDFVDLLIGVSKNHDDVRLDDHHIKAILMNTFVGGVDTSSITIVWAMSELIKNPRVMERVQKEIKDCIGRGKLRVDPGDLENLKYLKMVVKETLRLHPPVPLLIPHESIRQCRIGGENGYDIGPGTRVLINVWAIGRDPKSWKNPNEFFPERFDEKCDIDFKGGNFELLPFGAGRRICPGMNMASATIEFTLANLLYCFDWKMPCGMEIEDVSLEEESGITTHKSAPLYLVPTKHPLDE